MTTYEYQVKRKCPQCGGEMYEDEDMEIHCYECSYWEYTPE